MARRDNTHIHVHVDVDNVAVLARFDQLETLMSELSDAIAAQAAALTEATARIDADFAHLTDLLNQAIATDAADAAAIAAPTEQVTALTEDASAATAAINASTEALTAIDPDPTNP